MASAMAAGAPAPVRRRLLLGLAAACFAGTAVGDPTARLTRWGSGQLRRFGLLIYDATLWAGDDPRRCCWARPRSALAARRAHGGALALGADLALPAAIAADLAERQGRAGACFGVWNLVAKLSLALAAGLSLPLLGALGYVPGGDGGLAAPSFAYALLPLACKALAGWLLWRWRHSLEIRS